MFRDHWFRSGAPGGIRPRRPAVIPAGRGIGRVKAAGNAVALEKEDDDDKNFFSNSLTMSSKSMQNTRQWYYDLLSHVYDRFAAIHSRRDERNTRYFLVDYTRLEGLAKALSPFKQGRRNRHEFH